MDPATLLVQGHLTTATLPRVVRDLWRARATGILHISNGPVAKRIVFKNGEIVFAATNVEQERLGERLIRAGKIKRSILNLAFRVMERSHQRFGKTMVEWGWVSPWEMQRRVAEQIKDIVYSVFTWDSGDYRFEPSDEPVDPDLILELQTAEVIWEGARRIGNLNAIRVGVGDTRGVLSLKGGQRLAIPVGQEEGFVLARVNGRSTISDILSSCPLGEKETLRRIYALLLAGVLERAESGPTALADSRSESLPGSAGTPPSSPVPDAKSLRDERRFRDGVVARHAAMQFGNLYDRLGVDLSASTEEIRDAYRTVMKSLEPEPRYADNLQDLRRRLERVRRKVTDAYQVLTDPEQRRAYDRSMPGASPETTLAARPEPQPGADPTAKTLVSAASKAARDPGSEAADKKQEAKAHYVEARGHLEAGDYFDAIAAMGRAVRLDPGKGMYQRFLAELLAQNPSCSKAAREHFERAIHIDPKDTEAYLGLAALLEQDDLPEQARRLYEKVVSIDPRHRLARERLGRGKGGPSAMTSDRRATLQRVRRSSR